MASKVPPVKAVQFVFSTFLFSQSDNQIQQSATLASGDVKVSKDNGALANIASLPTESPAASGVIQITLSSTEMNADEVVVIFSDASGAEWNDQAIVLHTIASGKQFDNLSTLTAQQVWEYATRTLTSFGTLVADVWANGTRTLTSFGTLAADVWAYATRTLTQTAASVTAAVTGTSITVYRGTTWSISLTGLGDLSAYDTVYFSVKEGLNDSDDNAILRVKNAASGLERINKAAPTATSNGTITVDDVVAGDITITVQEAETQNMPLFTNYHYDVKGIDNNGSVDLKSVGVNKFTVSGDVTRKIT